MTELAAVSVTALKGVGAALAEKLAKVGLETLQDVLFHLPLRYQDRTRVVPIGHLRPGQDAVIEGTVSGADVVMGRRRSLVVRLQDGTGGLSLRFYHFSNAQKEGLKRGTQLRCYGEARPGASGLEIYHPEYRAITGDEPPPVDTTLTPIYPLTEGLTQQRLRQLCMQTLGMLGPQSLPDWLPDEHRAEVMAAVPSERLAIACLLVPNLMGPRGLTAMLTKHGEHIHALPMRVLNPLPWSMGDAWFNPQGGVTGWFGPDTMVAHLYASRLRKIHLRGRPRPHSFLADFAAEIGFSFAGA